MLSKYEIGSQYIHDYFFSKFPVILYEWLVQLTYRKTNFQGGEPACWTRDLIQQLEEVENRAMSVVEVWIDSILECYISDFTVDIVKSYSEVERELFKGPRGRFLLSLKLSINMLIFEKGMLNMKSIE